MKNKLFYGVIRTFCNCPNCSKPIVFDKKTQDPDNLICYRCMAGFSVKGKEVRKRENTVPIIKN